MEKRLSIASAPWDMDQGMLTGLHQIESLSMDVLHVRVASAMCSAASARLEERIRRVHEREEDSVDLGQNAVSGSGETRDRAVLKTRLAECGRHRVVDCPIVGAGITRYLHQCRRLDRFDSRGNERSEDNIIEVNESFPHEGSGAAGA
jgi:hypothetical protein